MHTSKGQVLELILENGRRQARISCPANLIPAPGQYLLASHASDSPLPVPIYYTDSAPQGFTASAPIPDAWAPGLELYLRGPLGRGFNLPVSARKVALIAFDDAPSRLRGLIAPALKQGAAVVLITDFDSDSLPDEVEVQPMSALDEIVDWADYIAFDAVRENLPELRECLGRMKQAWVGKDAQVLIRTPMPCGGVAECGVCAVIVKSGWEMACKDGPVFELKEI
jgi:dihydroorotate dehydrogenase electron transfer subunit